jgi:hypothetical protein
VQRRRRDLLLILGFILWLPATAILALFLAGAVAFPIVEPYYATRVAVSLGLMALVYGIESVFSLGVIETCGFLSGNCSTHILYPYAVKIWQVLVVLSLVALLCVLLFLRRSEHRKQ